ncbi:MAG: hypothetical protein V3U54_12580 [Thermodesulfobacteriota bacterium]
MWQIEELQRYIETNSNDALFNSKTVFLSNPKQIEEIEDIIVDQIWPGVTKALHNVPITTKIGTGQSPREGIHEKRHEYTTRELVFLLEDPKRPYGPSSNVPWYCRGKIECSLMSYMISLDFMVHFPERISFQKILNLLKEPKMQGCPPELSYNEASGDKSIFSVSFTKGSGAGWGLKTYDEAGEHVFKEVKKNMNVIEAVYDLEKDFENMSKFNSLHRALLEAYEAY